MNKPIGFNVLRTLNPRNAVFTYSDGELTLYSDAKLTDKGADLLISYAKKDSLSVYYKDAKRTVEGYEVVPAKSCFLTNGSILTMQIDEETFTKFYMFFPRIFNPFSVREMGIASETIGGYIYINGEFHSYHEGFGYSYNFITTEEFDTDRIIKDLSLLITGLLIRKGDYIKGAFLPEATALIPKLKRLGRLDEFLFNMSKYIGTFRAITFDESLKSSTVLYVPEHLRVSLQQHGFIFNMPVVLTVEGSHSSVLDDIASYLRGTDNF